MTWSIIFERAIVTGKIGLTIYGELFKSVVDGLIFENTGVWGTSKFAELGFQSALEQWHVLRANQCIKSGNSALAISHYKKAGTICKEIGELQKNILQYNHTQITDPTMAEITDYFDMAKAVQERYDGILFADKPMRGSNGRYSKEQIAYFKEATRYDDQTIETLAKREMLGNSFPDTEEDDEECIVTESEVIKEDDEIISISENNELMDDENYILAHTIIYDRTNDKWSDEAISSFKEIKGYDDEKIESLADMGILQFNDALSTYESIASENEYAM